MCYPWPSNYSIGHKRLEHVRGNCSNIIVDCRIRSSPISMTEAADTILGNSRYLVSSGHSEPQYHCRFTWHCKKDQPLHRFQLEATTAIAHKLLQSADSATSRSTVATQLRPAWPSILYYTKRNKPYIAISSLYHSLLLAFGGCCNYPIIM